MGCCCWVKFCATFTFSVELDFSVLVWGGIFPHGISLPFQRDYEMGKAEASVLRNL